MDPLAFYQNLSYNDGLGMDPMALTDFYLQHIDGNIFQTPPMIPWGGAGWQTTAGTTNQLLNMETARPDLAANE